MGGRTPRPPERQPGAERGHGLDLPALAAEHAGEAVAVADASGAILYANAAFAELSGYGPDELVGRNPRILKSGLQERAFYERLWSALLDGRTWRGRMVNRRKDGGLYTVDATISPVMGPLGAATHFVAVEREADRRDRPARRPGRDRGREAVATLAGGIAHKFNNMLMSILGFTDMAAKHLDRPDKAALYLDYVRRAGVAGAELVRQVQAYSRSGEARKVELDPGRAVGEALDMLKSAMDPRVGLRLHMDGDLPLILADPEALHQVLANLCGNALDALGNTEKAVLTVRLRRCLGDDDPGLGGGPWVLLEVEDNGEGMSEEVLERVWDPFFTTKKREGANGLGLSVVHGIVRDHEGHANVGSRRGWGTVVSLYFPALGEKDPRPGPPPEESPIDNATP